MWWCCVMPRQMGYIHRNYWLHWELSKIYEQLNSFSWNNKPSLVCTQLPLGLPKIVIQLDSGVVSFIWFCCNAVIKKILGHISIARTLVPVFKEFTRVCPNRNDCGIPPNLSEPQRSCGTKQWTATKYHPPHFAFSPLCVSSLETRHGKGTYPAESWQSGRENVSPLLLINVESL